MALVALLRRDGPQTATQAARAIGESVASCSFHLRQMAKYGLVEAAASRGREKPWRATAMFTELDSSATDPVAAAATQAMALSAAERYFELMAHWVRAQPEEPAEWREAAQFGDTMLYLTAAELADLGGRLQDVLEPYLDRLGDPARRPAGTRAVTVLTMAFPAGPASRRRGSPWTAGRGAVIMTAGHPAPFSFRLLRVISDERGWTGFRSRGWHRFRRTTAAGTGV